jgi:hypothetical protein
MQAFFIFWVRKAGPARSTSFVTMECWLLAN